MRFKAIPEEIVHTVAHRPFLALGALVVAGVGFYAYYKSDIAPVAEASTDTGYYGFNAPVAYPVNASDTGADNSIIPLSSGDVSNAALFDFEKQKDAEQFALATMQLESNTNIAIANATLALAGIQASNYNTATNLAISMLSSHATSITGAISSPDGTPFYFGIAQTLATTSKNKKTIAANTASNAAGQSAFNSFMVSLANMGNNNASLPGTGTSNNSIIAGALAALPTSGYGPETNAVTAAYAGSDTVEQTAIYSPAYAAPLIDAVNGGSGIFSREQSIQ